MLAYALGWPVCWAGLVYVWGFRPSLIDELLWAQLDRTVSAHGQRVGLIWAFLVRMLVRGAVGWLLARLACPCPPDVTDL